jgi:hypothetical protein
LGRAQTHRECEGCLKAAGGNRKVTNEPLPVARAKFSP